MLRVLFGLFLVAHGLVHAAVWATPTGDRATMPFDPSHSWLFQSLGVAAGTMRVLGLALALVAMLGFVGAGLGVFGHQPWWPAVAIAAAAISLTLVVLYFHPWLSAAVLLDAGIVLFLLWTSWPAGDVAGA